jgi:uncharacterized protein (UPF0276 family)
MRQPIPVDVGIELRPEHHALVLERRPAVAWFEVPAETLLTRGDGWRAIELVAREYPLSLHAAGLSLASVTRLAATHLGHLREWVTRLQPDFVSHPLSWSAAEGAPLPDLVSIVRNVNCVQEILQRQILLENASKPLDLPDGALSEAAFLAEVVLRTGCGIALNVSNLHSTAFRLGASANALLADFLEALEPDCIAEIRLAGRSITRGQRRGPPILAAAWKLFETAVATLGPVPTLLEWDSHPPTFDVLQAEAAAARSMLLRSTRQADLYATAPVHFTCLPDLKTTPAP